jgi:hypothetical protein
MKIKLWLGLVLVSNLMLSQVPSDYIMKYSFTNGSLQNEDAGTTGDFTQTGTTLTAVIDRGGTPNDAIQLNQDVLESSQLSNETANIAEMTMSFWINPTTATTNTQREILRMPSAFFGREFWIREDKSQNELSFYASGRNTNTNANLVCTLNVTDASLFDNNWHHVVYRAYLFNPQNLTFQVYIDGVLKTDSSNFGCGLNNFNNGVPPQFLTRPRLTLSTNSTIKYTNQIDDIYFYKRALSSTEIAALNNEVTLGLEEFQETSVAFELKMYPNPAISVVRISSNRPIKNIQIYNITGVKVLESENNVLDVSKLKTGVYLIKITNSFNQQITKRFIKS